MEAPIPDAPSTIRNKGIIKKKNKGSSDQQRPIMKRGKKGDWVPVYQ